MSDQDVLKGLTAPGFIEAISKLHPVAQVAVVLVVGAIICVGLICAMKFAIKFWT